MTKGMSWPVVLIVYTSEIWLPDIVASMKKMKRAIVASVMALDNKHRTMAIFLRLVSKTF